MMYYVHILSSYVFYFQSYSLMDSDKGLSESFSAKPLLSAIINMPVAEMIWVSVLYTFFNKPDVILLLVVISYSWLHDVFQLKQGSNFSKLKYLNYVITALENHQYMYFISHRSF